MNGETPSMRPRDPLVVLAQARAERGVRLSSTPSSRAQRGCLRSSTRSVIRAHGPPFRREVRHEPRLGPLEEHQHLVNELAEVAGKLRQALAEPDAGASPPSARKRSGPGALLKVVDAPVDPIAERRARRSLGRPRRSTRKRP